MPLQEIDEPIPFEEVQERRRRRWLFFGLPLIAILLTGLGFVALPTGRAIKGWQSRRLAREAFALIDRAQWQEASDKARDAYVLRMTEPEAWRAIATLLSRTGQVRAALDWWKQVDAAHLLTLADRRAYAAAALDAGALPEAATQVEWLLAYGHASGPLDTADNLLASQLASRQGDSSRAEDYARSALTNDHNQPSQQMAAVLQVFTITQPDSPLYAAAWTQLLRLARDPASSMSLDALRLLADPKLPPPTQANTLVPDANPAVTTTVLTPDEIAAAIDAHPAARAEDHLLAWELRVRAHPETADALLTEGVQRFGHGDDGALASLARFLNARHRSATTLELLSAERAGQTRELTLAYLDALADLGRWQEIKDALAAGRLRLDPLSRHLYLAADSTKLGEVGRTAGEWDQALQVAGTDPPKLLNVGSYAEKWDALDTADTAYAAAIKAAPDQPNAYKERERLAETRGQTALARSILVEVTRRWPDDERARTREVYLGLLLDPSGESARDAAQEVTPQASAQPANWSARATLALARLRKGEATTALAAFSGDRGSMDPQAHPGDDVPPGAQAIWVAALAANGWKAEAAAEASRLLVAPLLPEERTMINAVAAKGSLPSSEDDRKGHPSLGN